MQGLRKPENTKFEKFFNMVQEEAKKKNAVFFLDCGMGDIFENDTIECEDMCGWLIPEDMVATFEPVFENGGNEQHNFDDFYVFIDYTVSDNGIISIDIDDTPNDLIIDDFNVIANETEII